MNSETGILIYFTLLRKSQNRRMAWVGRDMKNHPVPSPLPWAGQLPLDQDVQSPIQFGLNLNREITGAVVQPQQNTKIQKILRP